MITTIKTFKDFSAHSAWGLGGANGSAVVPTAAGSADVPVRIVAGLTPAFCRAAAMLLTVLMAFAGAQTAGATTWTVTYTIGYSSGNGYYLAGDDGTQSAYFINKVEMTLNLALGSDVTITIVSADGENSYLATSLRTSLPSPASTETSTTTST